MGRGLDAGLLSITMYLGSAHKFPGPQCPFLIDEGAGHRGVMEGFSGWNDLGELPSLDTRELGMLRFPSSWDIVELAHLGSGLSRPDEHFLSSPSFCSSSHPHGTLSGRTSMFGPNACGFEHHSLGLARCQHSGWFRCHSQSFDRRELIRACFCPSQAAVFKPQGSVFMSSPALLVQPCLMGTWSVRPFAWQIMRWLALSNTSSQRPTRLPRSAESSLKS